MADIKFSEFPKANQSKDSDEIAILQDGVNKMIASPVLESKIINKTVSRVIEQGGASLNMVNLKGVVPTYADLGLITPTPELNDAYQVEADGLIYVYTESGFQSDGEGIVVQPEPIGVVEEGNTQAVSGGEVYNHIKDTSVKMTNLFQNSSFENGIIAPTTKEDDINGASTLSINTINPISGNYDARLEVTTPAMRNNRPILHLNGLQHEWVLNHIFYFSMSVKVNNGDPIITSVHNGSGTPALNLDLKDGFNSWTVKCLGLTTGFGYIYLDGSTLWDFNFDNLIAYDLTAIFGEGNEPTKEEMDLLIQTLETDYFEGEITIPAQKIMQWQQNLISAKADHGYASIEVAKTLKQVEDSSKDTAVFQAGRRSELPNINIAAKKIEFNNSRLIWKGGNKVFTGELDLEPKINSQSVFLYFNTNTETITPYYLNEINSLSDRDIFLGYVQRNPLFDGSFLVGEYLVNGVFLGIPDKEIGTFVGNNKINLPNINTVTNELELKKSTIVYKGGYHTFLDDVVALSPKIDSNPVYLYFNTNTKVVSLYYLTEIPSIANEEVFVGFIPRAGRDGYFLNGGYLVDNVFLGTSNSGSSNLVFQAGSKTELPNINTVTKQIEFNKARLFFSGGYKDFRDQTLDLSPKIDTGSVFLYYNTSSKDISLYHLGEIGSITSEEVFIGFVNRDSRYDGSFLVGGGYLIDGYFLGLGDDGRDDKHTVYYPKPQLPANEDPSSDFNSETMTSAEYHAAMDILVSNSGGRLTKTFLSKDQSGVFDIFKYNLKPLSKYGTDLPKILIVSNIHGPVSDPTTASIGVYRLINYLLNDYKDSPDMLMLKHNYELIFIPMANPWGCDNKSRHNSRNVDINRNFGSSSWEASTDAYKGESPFSEIETQNIRDTAISEGVDAIIDIHCHNTAPTLVIDSADIQRKKLGWMISDFIYDEYGLDLVTIDSGLSRPISIAWGNENGYISYILEFIQYETDGVTKNTSLIMEANMANLINTLKIINVE